MSNDKSEPRKDSGVPEPVKDSRLTKFMSLKLAGLSDKEASREAGYKGSYTPASRDVYELTMKELFDLEGMDDSYLIKNIKNVIDNATKLTAAGNTVHESPDWQNRLRAMELVFKSTSRLSPIKSEVNMNVKTNPFGHLTDLELSESIIREGEILDVDDNYRVQTEEVDDKGGEYK